VSTFVETALLMFVLLNPFTMSIYLLDLVRSLERGVLALQLLRAAVISAAVFAAFAAFGDRIFTDVLQVRFIAFQIFGGITFLIIGIRLILGVRHPVPALNPEEGQISGSIAMPFIVGPGTITAAVIAGSRQPVIPAIGAILIALASAVVMIIAFKLVYDWALGRNERLIQRYINISGRVTALFTGSFAIEMILSGVESWLKTIFPQA
jgi:multiple antibiotic resistance protein